MLVFHTPSAGGYPEPTLDNTIKEVLETIKKVLRKYSIKTLFKSGPTPKSVLTETKPKSSKLLKTTPTDLLLNLDIYTQTKPKRPLQFLLSEKR